jgi:hypothetical protein
MAGFLFFVKYDSIRARPGKEGAIGARLALLLSFLPKEGLACFAEFYFSFVFPKEEGLAGFAEFFFCGADFPKL